VTEQELIRTLAACYLAVRARLDVADNGGGPDLVTAALEYGRDVDVTREHVERVLATPLRDVPGLADSTDSSV
jgi:hypothetical protein